MQVLTIDPTICGVWTRDFHELSTVSNIYIYIHMCVRLSDQKGVSNTGTVSESYC